MPRDDELAKTLASNISNEEKLKKITPLIKTPGDFRVALEHLNKEPQRKFIRLFQTYLPRFMSELRFGILNIINSSLHQSNIGTFLFYLINNLKSVDDLYGFVEHSLVYETRKHDKNNYLRDALDKKVLEILKTKNDFISLVKNKFRISENLAETIAPAMVRIFKDRDGLAKASLPRFEDLASYCILINAYDARFNNMLTTNMQCSLKALSDLNKVNGKKNAEVLMKEVVNGIRKYDFNELITIFTQLNEAQQSLFYQTIGGELLYFIQTYSQFRELEAAAISLGKLHYTLISNLGRRSSDLDRILNKCFLHHEILCSAVKYPDKCEEIKDTIAKSISIDIRYYSNMHSDYFKLLLQFIGPRILNITTLTELRDQKYFFTREGMYKFVKNTYLYHHRRLTWAGSFATLTKNISTLFYNKNTLELPEKDLLRNHLRTLTRNEQLNTRPQI